MLYGRSGQVQRAIDELRILVADYEKWLDVDHPGALAARRDIAEWLIVAGDPTAISLLRDLAADQARLWVPSTWTPSRHDSR